MIFPEVRIARRTVTEENVVRGIVLDGFTKMINGGSIVALGKLGVPFRLESKSLGAVHEFRMNFIEKLENVPKFMKALLVGIAVHHQTQCTNHT